MKQTSKISRRWKCAKKICYQAGIGDRRCGDPPKNVSLFGVLKLILGKERKDRWYRRGYDSQAGAAAAEEFTAKQAEKERQNEEKHTEH